MRKSRIAADPLVNFSTTEIARYTDNRSQLSDLIYNTYILSRGAASVHTTPKSMLELSEVHWALPIKFPSHAVLYNPSPLNSLHSPPNVLPLSKPTMTTHQKITYTNRTSLLQRENKKKDKVNYSNLQNVFLSKFSAKNTLKNWHKPGSLWPFTSNQTSIRCHWKSLPCNQQSWIHDRCEEPLG